MAPTDSVVRERNVGTQSHPPGTDPGYPRRPVTGAVGGGASVVVRARESRVHGEGEQRAGRASKPEERFVDSNHQADKAWLLNVPRKLYQWSQTHSDDAYRDLWNWALDRHNLRDTRRTIASNRGRRTLGVDGVTVGQANRGSSDPWVSRPCQRIAQDRLTSPWLLESRMHNERCTSGSARGHGKPTAETPHGARAPLNCRSTISGSAHFSLCSSWMCARAK